MLRLHGCVARIFQEKYQWGTENRDGRALARTYRLYGLFITLSDNFNYRAESTLTVSCVRIADLHDLVFHFQL